MNEENVNFMLENELANDNFPLEAVGHVALNLAYPLQEDQEQRQIPRNQNYYELTIGAYMGDLFVNHFRMTRNACEQLTVIIGNDPNNRPSIIPLEKRILFSIWILAKPECFLAAGDRFGLAKSTAHGVFKDIVFILIRLLPRYVVWPENRQHVINVFHDRSNGFPGVVGAIDGCHIAIKQPENNPHDYYNRKEYHSIILQGLCDHRMLFLDVFIGIPGRVHDARVLRISPIYARLINEENPLLPPNEHILGDSAYPLMLNLLTPYRDNGHLNNSQTNFNYKLSGLRSIIERVFALLIGKFRRLKYLDIKDPDFGSQIIAASCVLHNFIILHDDEMYNEDFNINLEVFNQGIDEDRDRQIEKRDVIANLLFNH